MVSCPGADPRAATRAQLSCRLVPSHAQEPLSRLLAPGPLFLGDTPLMGRIVR